MAETPASLIHTPTWAIATVCSILIITSILLEHALDLLTKFLRKRRRKSLIQALSKVKAELMRFGFISLLLTVMEQPISKICIPKSVGDTFLPCKNTTLPSNIAEEPTCHKKGKISLLSRTGVNELHILIFLLAFFHVLSFLITQALGMAKMKKSETAEEEKPKTFQHPNGDTEETPSRKHMDNFANSDGKLPKVYLINEIEKATDNFSKENNFATGGNGNVYRGTLDDTKVAIKCPIECNDIEIKHISNEINIHVHGQVKHPSIVELHGFSLHDNKPYVVYKYMSKGNLFDHLHLQGTFLNWRRRLTVASQIADALIYLHHSIPKIIHVDVKSENILFDDNFNAKLSDFGHSQIIESGKSHKCMTDEGTPALIDPRWRETRILTDKTDVYCFGILLLELLTSKKVAEFKKGQDGAFLVEKSELMEAADRLQKDGMRQVVCKQMMAIHSMAVKCVSHRIEDRPSMKEVAEQIQRIRNWDAYFSSYIILY